MNPSLHDVQQFNQEIIDCAAEGIIVCDRELRYQVWNRFMEHLTGLRTEQVLGKRAVDFFPVLGEQPIEDILTRVLTGETVAIAETGYVVPGTDKQGWISASYRPQFDSKGHVTGAIGRVLDLSERKQAKRELLQSEERFQLAVRGSVAGIWDWNVITNEVFYADRFREFPNGVAGGRRIWQLWAHSKRGFPGLVCR